MSVSSSCYECKLFKIREFIFLIADPTQRVVRPTIPVTPPLPRLHLMIKHTYRYILMRLELMHSLKFREALASVATTKVY